VSQSEERDNRKRTFNIARSKLHNAGLVTLDNGQAAIARVDMEWPDDAEDEQ
jgi:hypothetical protein